GVEENVVRRGRRGAGQQGRRGAATRRPDARRGGVPASDGSRVMRAARRAIAAGLALTLAGCLGVTTESSAPVLPNASRSWASLASVPTARPGSAAAAPRRHVWGL